MVLVSGDAHRVRVIRHATRALVGYDLTELVASPLAHRVHEETSVPHAGLLFDGGSEQGFLLLSADAGRTPPVLVAEMVDAVGGESVHPGDAGRGPGGGGALRGARGSPTGFSDDPREGLPTRRPANALG